MAAQNDVSNNKEVRKLDYLHKQRLGQFLDPNNSWKKLMNQIPMTFKSFHDGFHIGLQSLRNRLHIVSLSTRLNPRGFQILIELIPRVLYIHS